MLRKTARDKFNDSDTMYAAGNEAGNEAGNDSDTMHAAGNDSDAIVLLKMKMKR